MADWLHQDEQRLEYWQAQAWEHLESAARRPHVANENGTDREVASQRLAQQLKSEVAQGIPFRVEGLYGDLLSEVLVEVNWTELAEDFARSH